MSDKIIDRVVVLKNEGDKLIFPSSKYISENAPEGLALQQFTMFRIQKYDSESGELSLKYYPDRLSENSFIISREENDSFFQNLIIHKINFVFKDFSHFASQNFNSDINLEDRWDAVAYKVPRIAAGPTETLIKEDISISFEKIILKDGIAVFRYYMKAFNCSFWFEIQNPDIKKEYDSIKNYFIKIWNLKKIPVHVFVNKVGGEFIEVKASSTYISEINNDLFNKVEDNIINDKLIHSDEGVFLAEEKLKDLSEIFGTEKYNDVTWLFDRIVVAGLTKHYYHLRYLSSKHVREIFNLYLTGKPFSFIFLIPSKRGYVLIWETYNTDEATYLWKVEGNTNGELQATCAKHIEQIKILRQKQKKNFLKTQPDNFIRIRHEYEEADFGFNKWKNKVVDFTKSE